MHIRTQGLALFPKESKEPFERINLINESVIKSVTCHHLTAVLVSSSIISVI